MKVSYILFDSLRNVRKDKTINYSYINEKYFHFKYFKERSRHGILSKGHIQDKEFYLSLRKYISERFFSILSLNKFDLLLLDPVLTYLIVPAVKSHTRVFYLDNTLSASFSAQSPPIFYSFPTSKLRLLHRPINLFHWGILLLKRHWRNLLLLFNLVKLDVWSLTWAERISLKKMGFEILQTEYGEIVKIPTLKFFPPSIRSFFCHFIDYPLVSFIGNYSEINKRKRKRYFRNVRKKNIYCSLGSNSNVYPMAAKLYSNLGKVFMENPQWELVVSSNSDLKSFFPAENCRVIPWVNQRDILKDADLFITQGGATSLRESIVLETPLLVVPMWHDQHGNGSMVERARIGLCLLPSLVSQETLKQKMNKLFAGTEYRSNLRKMKPEFGNSKYFNNFSKHLTEEDHFSIDRP